MHSRLKNTLAVLFLVFTGIMVSGNHQANAAPTVSEERETVVLQLKWFHQFQFAGYYAALEKGYYSDEGMDVEIRSGGPDIKVDREVIKGNANFGVLASELVKKRAAGKPVVLVAVIMQHSVRAIIVREDSPINSPSTLAGKKIMLNRNEDAEFMAMLRSEGVDTNRITIIPKTNTANDGFIQGEIDGLNGSIGNQPYLFQQKGIPVRLIRPINYGIDFYGDSLFTSETEIKHRPKRVEAFRRASIRGWRYAMDHPDEMISIIREKYNSNKTYAQLRFEAEAMRTLILPDLVDIGHINPNRIKRIAEIYSMLGTISPPYSLEGLIYKPDSGMRFLKRLLTGFVGVSVFVVVIMVILAAFNRRLKKLVRLRTDELSEKNKELKTNFNLLYSLIDGTTDLIFVKDLSGRYILVNSAFATLSGTAPQEIFGKKNSDLFHHELASTLDFHDQIVLQEEKPVIKEEVFPVLDTEKTFLTNRGVFFDHAGKVDGIFGISHDITGILETEEEKQRLVLQMQQLQKMEAIGTLAGGIAHDFNNILTAILGNAELAVADSSPDQKTHNYAKEILIASNRAKDLVKQILAFSRQSDATQEPVDPVLVVKEAVKLIRASIPTTIEIRTMFDSGCDTLFTNSTQFHQIVMNLCTNAYHSMKETGGELSIGLSPVVISKSDQKVTELKLAPGRYVCLEVSDTGCGMDRNTLDKIFHPYFTTKKQGEGSGMGLSVVHGIVKAMNGHISVYSEPDLGSTFRLFFPHMTPSPYVDVEKTNEELPTGEETILFVDDEVPIINLAKQMLNRLGYTVETASTSRGALELFRNNPDTFDLVISDMAMPEMDGATLSTELMEIRSNIPVILCTGFSEIINGDKAKAIGVKAFLTKPVVTKTMATVVRKVLDNVT